jgi:hypothetical protein
MSAPGAVRRGKESARPSGDLPFAKRIDGAGRSRLHCLPRNEPPGRWVGMKRSIAIGLVCGAVAGCAAEAEREAARLSLACQVSKCDCASDIFVIFDSEPIQWKDDGSASCPEGYHLRRLTPAPENPL